MCARYPEDPGAAIPHAGICKGGDGQPVSLPPSEEMKPHHALFVAQLFATTLEATPIFTKDFEDGMYPGMIDGTSVYANITGSLEPNGNGHHARYDFTVPAEPNAGVTWHGGLTTDIGNFSSLPPVWQLSFRLATSAPVPEPIRIRFSHYTKPRLRRGDPVAEGVTLTFWITPTGTGWQQIVIQSSDVEVVQNTFTSARMSTEPDTYLEITAHSRGPSGELLSLSGPGNHFLLLDEIDFRIPIIPFVSLQPRSDGKLSLFYTGTLQESGGLDGWTTPFPQRAPHSIIVPTGSRRFYRSSAE